ncbi:MAG: transcription antitermination factor NusB [Microthrixaceae bacterium]
MTPVDGPGEPPDVSQSVIDSVLDSGVVIEEIQVEKPPPLRSVAGGRHEARERAFHLLYETHIKTCSIQEVLEEQVLSPDPYTIKLLEAVDEHFEELTGIIDRLAKGWSVERMPSLDVALLRIGLCELAYCPEVPSGVVLSEAVALAGHYGTDDSSRFVNGLLSAATEELRPE